MPFNPRILIALFLALVAFFLLAALLAGQNPQQPRANPMCLYGPGQWLESSLNDQTLTGKLALELMYGPDSNAICTNFFNLGYPGSAENYPYFAHLSTRYSLGIENRVEDRVVFVASVAPSSEPSRYVAITAQTCQYCSCMACSGRLFGAIFTREGNKWKTLAATHYITDFGSWGEFHDLPENKQFVEIGSDKYGILLKDTSTTLGYTGTFIIIIAEVNGQLQTIFDANTAGSGYCDHGTVPKCWHYDSEVRFTDGDNPDYYDLQITTQGTRSDPSEQIKDASRVSLFQFKNGHYVSTAPQ